jgi:hypothetical protein
MRTAFVQVVVNALRGKPVSGASVRQACTEAQCLYLQLAVGRAGKYG